MKDDLDTATQELYEERAAIMHHCGGLPKEKAERLARAEADTWRKHRENAARDAEAQK